MKSLLDRKFVAVTAMVIGMQMTVAGAWTSDTEKLADDNNLCKLEPESQCSWIVLVDKNMSGVDMHDSSLASARLDRSNLQGANLSGSFMQFASLKGANLMMANFEGTHLRGASLEGSNLMLANLQKSNLVDADLRGANLQGANLNGAILIQTKLGGATWTDGRVCAAGSKGECL
ncbi:MAG: pentapeptide repeat-containing protein [Gammaproteobacteria bacterium]|nr:pentapeptide repeat-containing protein [Gammaproteobacteria bacterium]